MSLYVVTPTVPEGDTLKGFNHGYRAPKISLFGLLCPKTALRLGRS